METVDSIGHRALITVPKAFTDVALSEIRQGEKRQRTALAFVVTDLEKDQERRAKVAWLSHAFSSVGHVCHGFPVTIFSGGG
jgi:hypothetical protein